MLFKKGERERVLKRDVVKSMENRLSCMADCGNSADRCKLIHVAPSVCDLRGEDEVSGARPAGRVSAPACGTNAFVSRLTCLRLSE